MERKLFGTDGIRGLANRAPMEPETALALGRAIAYVFQGRGGKHRRIVIGKDTRRSGYMLENALSSGICSMGGEAIFLGPLPTPGIAYITQAIGADAGVVISASHNPYYDNGIKFFDHRGYKLPDEIECQMEDLLWDDRLKSGPTHGEVGKAYRVEDASGRYIEHLKSSFPKKFNLKGMKIVVDCAHGAAYKIAPMVLEELGAEVVALGVAPNGLNINDGCGALFPESLQKRVLEEKAHFGIALDGDADRLVLVDEKGQIVHGDALIALCARHLLRQGTLLKNTVVATIMSNLGLEIAMQKLGIQLRRVQVGDRYILEELQKGDFNFGGEQSGHLIFRDHSTTGDGCLAALQVLNILQEEGKTLSELAQGIEILPQVLINLKVRAKEDLQSFPKFKALHQEVVEKLGHQGRLLLRYSGTEPVLRIMLEGENIDQIEGYAQALKSEAEKILGAA